MERKESPKISIEQEVEFKDLYIGKHGAVTDLPMEVTEGHVYPVETTRPSTGAKSKYPYQVERKGTVKK